MTRILLGIALSCAVSAAGAQAFQRVPRVGVLYLTSASQSEGTTSGFDKGMPELGYVPGRNLVIERRDAEGRPDRLPALAAGQQKRLELLKEVLPGISRVGLVIAPFELHGGGSDGSEQTNAAAKRLGLQLEVVPVRDVADLEGIGRALRQGHLQALVTVETTFVVTNRARIAEQAERQGIPIAGEFTIFGAEEVLFAYGADLNDLLRRAATYVDRILKGAHAGDLPIERPTKLELTVNRKVARRLGIAIPPSIMLRADRVIE